MIAVGLDLETTGLLGLGHRIMEVAMLIYDTNTKKQIGKFVRKFNPGRPVEAKALEVHGITFDSVSHLPKLEEDTEAISFMQRILSKTDFTVAHNGIGFDWPFLQMEFDRIGKELPSPPMVDTMTQGRWATPYGKSPNLRELCFACGVSYDTALAHAAEYDVQVMMDCFFHAWETGFYCLPLSLQPLLSTV